MGIVFALLNTMAAGGANFLGGAASRRISPFKVVGLQVLIAFVILAPIVAIDHANFRARDLVLGMIAGVFAVSSTVALNESFRGAPLGVSSSIAGVIGTSLPVVWDALFGESVEQLTWFALAIGIVAVVMLTKSPDHAVVYFDMDRAPRAYLLAVLAGIGFAGVLIGLSGTSHVSPFVPSFGIRIIGMCFLVIPMLIKKQIPMNDPLAMRQCAAIAILFVSADACYIYARQHISLSAVSVILAFYTVWIVVLARLFLKERLHIRQYFGFVLSLAAVILVSASQ